ncbi:metal-dependent hydrolase [Pseudomonas sp. UL073]|uniref:Metal-dependent hydrolase n=1 Tax=Zestomonas insulae TaxID=2809017 RepID=A0ABS2I9I1_9GAMM|nr:metal-dependent hydrolase [Pseudomonas insulae]MBM7059650.1 metal-dependent hydrolase [Pseudomonas insulae]
MDSITQMALGATLQGALLGRWQGRKALLYGALLGTLPDLDVLIDYRDAVDWMTHHRGFSHSLLFLSGLAALLTWLVRRRYPHAGYSTQRLLLTLWLVLVTHPLLDCFTSYGTQFFWPLNSPPVAWSTVFIIDPLYTLPLLAAIAIGLLQGLRGRASVWPLTALGLSCLYLAFTVAGKVMAEARVEPLLAQQGIRLQALFSAPTPFNSLLWRVVVIDGNDYHEALVSWFDEQPPRLERIPRGTALAAPLTDSPQWQRLRWFTGDVLRYDRLGAALVVTDLRLGMTGYHPFRFVMAEWRGGGWQLAPVVNRWPSERGDLAQLRLLWTRIWDERQTVPLAQWARELEQR